MPRKNLKNRAKSSVKKAGSGVKTTGKVVLGVGLMAAIWSWWAILRARAKTSGRAHAHLRSSWHWYDQWHTHKYHKHVHATALALFLLAIAVNAGIFKLAFASDVFDSWNFATPANFTIDSTAETSGTSVRLKAQGYSSDANTAALYHLDSSSGTTLTDSSSNGNTATAVGSPSWVIGNLNNALSLNGSTQYASASDSSSLSLTQNNTLEAWTKFSSTFGANTHQQQQGILDKGSYKLYYDYQTGKVTYELANSGANTWTQQGGGDLLAGNGANIKGSWDTNGKNNIESQAVIGTDVYVGLGSQPSDAEVWKVDTTTNMWTKVGGQGINSSWANGTFEEVASMATDGTNLYVGLGNSTNDAEVWRYTSGSWTKVGGDGVNSSWSANYEIVSSLAVNGTTVFAGLGNNTAGDAEVWRCTSCSTSPSWGGALIGGDGVNSSWANSTYEIVTSMVLDGSSKPIIGLGNGSGDGEVWACTTNCSSGTPTWSKLGGDGTGPLASMEVIQSMTMMGGNLYVGTGNNAAGDGKVYRYASGVWTQVGGDVTCGGSCSSSWPSNYETIRSLATDGTYLYAGLGDTAGDNELWKCTGCGGGSPSWTQIGGDGSGAGGQSWGATLTFTGTISIVGSKMYAGVGSASSNIGTSEVWTCDLSATCTTTAGWTKVAGNYVNKSWGFFNLNSVESLTTAGGYLYAGTGNGRAGNAMVWRFDGTTWTMVGGQGINSSWADNTYLQVTSMIDYGSDLIIGLGNAASSGLVWKCSGCDGNSPTWTQIGGGGSASGGQSWATATYENVYSMAIYGGNLYIGLGTGSNDGDVWKCTGSCTTTSGWSQVGGDNLNSGWNTGFEGVASMTTYNGYLYVGLGNSTNDAEVWRWNGSSWGGARIGGKGTNSSWNTNYEYVDSMVIYNGKLYIGLASSTGDAEVWQCTDCDGGSPSWAKVGGDSDGSDNLGWLDSTYERVRSLAVYNGELYAGLGVTAGDGEVWKYDGTSWTQIGGDSLNGGWLTGTGIENVGVLQTYNGRLYAGTGDTLNGDGMVWSYGNNYVLQSSTTSQDTNWHHIAATYDGSTMKLYIDGTLNANASVSQTMPDNSLPLLVGSTYGSTGAGKTQGLFTGSLDEVRISNTARNSFTTLPYTSSAVTVRPNSAIHSNGIKSWDSFSASETTNGGTITYRLSSDGGTNWKYWDGAAWSTSVSTAQANDAPTINSHISGFPVVLGGGLMWQAILQGNGNQQVTLNSVSVNSTADVTAPEVNASSVAMSKSNGGTSVSSNGWSNGTSPYFTWTAGTDAGAGIKGYCLYLGQTLGADPTSTKGMLGTSPVATTGTNCQFIVPSNSVDLASSGYLASALTTSNNPYYLYVAAVDNAGNAVSNSSTEFHFRFDNTAPTNPAYVTSPSGFINTKQATLSWQTVGGDAPSDNNSGLAGIQYRIGPSSDWYGELHSGTQDATDLLTNDGSYTTQLVPDYTNIAEGINTIYFRTWDQAGNVTTNYTTAALKVNTSGAPSSPQNVTATPSTNTDNSFAFSWQKPSSFVGNSDGSSLTYCWTVNTLPSAGNCNWLSTGTTSLSAGPYATQPGTNNFYVVAKDESSNVNYDTYSSVAFTANTSAPGAPLNPDVVDASVKVTSNWRLALTWEAPSSVGSGVANYKVYRSTNNVNFNVVATTTTTSLVDLNLSQTTYYYYVKACDSANNCGVASSTVSKYPTGRFTSAATLTSDPRVGDISTRKATVTWSTDRTSDSRIQLSTQAGVYGSDEISNSRQVTSHEVNLNNLAAGTTYYYKAKWTDEDGNIGTSPEYSFVTSPAPTVKEVATSKVTLTSATIQLTTKGAAKIKLYYGKSDSFGGNKVINTSTSESTYSTELTGLDDGAKYFYKINAFDEDGNEYDGNTLAFTTPQRPKISELKFEPVAGEPTSTQRVTWLTNVPASSQISYGVSGKSAQDIIDNVAKTEHEITMKGLEDNSEYYLIAQSRDGEGNLATSDRQIFHTALDTRPPKISDLNVESTIRGTGSDARGQLIVSWTTDEPSTSQVAFGEGSSGVATSSQTTEDANLTTEHTVVISDLSTAKVYNVVAQSRDRAGNQAKSDSQSSIIGRASDSVLSIIFNTLQKIFGFIGK